MLEEVSKIAIESKFPTESGCSTWEYSNSSVLFTLVSLGKRPIKLPNSARPNQHHTIPASILLTNPNGRDPRIPSSFLAAHGRIKIPRRHHQLIVRSHGRLGIAHDLQETQAAPEFPALVLGAEGGVRGAEGRVGFRGQRARGGLVEGERPVGTFCGPGRWCRGERGRGRGHFFFLAYRGDVSGRNMGWVGTGEDGLRYLADRCGG